MLKNQTVSILDLTLNIFASPSQRLSVTNTYLSLYRYSEAKPTSTIASKQTLNEDLQRLDVTVDSARID